MSRLFDRKSKSSTKIAKDYHQDLTQDFVFLLDLCKKPNEVFCEWTPEYGLSQRWLNKLCRYECENLQERRLRNVYMSHLCACLNDGRLKGPFLHKPKKGKLEPFFYEDFDQEYANKVELKKSVVNVTDSCLEDSEQQQQQQESQFEKDYISQKSSTGILEQTNLRDSFEEEAGSRKAISTDTVTMDVFVPPRQSYDMQMPYNNFSPSCACPPPCACPPSCGCMPPPPKPANSYTCPCTMPCPPNCPFATSSPPNRGPPMRPPYYDNQYPQFQFNQRGFNNYPPSNRCACPTTNYDNGPSTSRGKACKQEVRKCVKYNQEPMLKMPSPPQPQAPQKNDCHSSPRLPGTLKGKPILEIHKEKDTRARGYKTPSFLCMYMNQQLNTPVNIEDLTADFSKKCKAKQSSPRSKPTNPPELCVLYSAKNGESKMVPSLTSTENNEFQANISELLEIISRELRGDCGPGCSAFLEHELNRYQEFIMSYSNIARSMRKMQSKPLMRSFMLVHLQNDLIKLLTESLCSDVDSFGAGGSGSGSARTDNTGGGGSGGARGGGECSD